MDPFEVRLNLISHLQRLTSSQASINSTVRFLTKHGARCGGDLWECLVEECEKASINARINILYLLDTLLLTSTNAPSGAGYDYAAAVQRDLPRLVEAVVPPSRDGLLNLLSVRQMLGGWKMKRVVDPHMVDRLQEVLVRREQELGQAAVAPPTGDIAKFSRRDVLERINDDRERHKRLRERMWVLPVPPLPSLLPKGTSAPAILATGHRLATFAPTSSSDPSDEAGQEWRQAGQGSHVALEVEFEQLWTLAEADGRPVRIEAAAG